MKPGVWSRVVGGVGVLFAGLAGAATVYVDLNSANPVPPFNSWETAATNIAQAVGVASPGDQVLVAGGTYLVPAQIVVSSPITVRGFSGPSETIVARHPDVTNARVFYVDSPGALIADLTISNGWVTTVNSSGAGVYLARGTVSNCVFRNNYLPTNAAGFGGGIDIWTGTVLRCAFYGNGSTNIYAGTYGGAISVRWRADIFDSLFVSNRAWAGAGVAFLNATFTARLERCSFLYQYGLYGGGVNLGGNGIVISDCIFSNNVATGTGSGLNFGWSFIAQSIFRTNAWITGCHIYGTMTPPGRGAFYGTAGQAVIDRCLVEAHYDADRAAIHLTDGGVLRNCLVVRNSRIGGAASGAGGILVGRAVVENCTVSANSGTAAAGDYIAAGGIFATNSYVVNCVVYSNSGQIAWNRVHDIMALGTTRVANSCFSPRSSSNLFEGAAVNSITSPPQFVTYALGFGTNAAGGNFRLQASSPCINAGENAPWMVGAKDFDGNRRIQPWNGLVDMGAYEYGFPGVGSLLLVR